MDFTSDLLADSFQIGDIISVAFMAPSGFIFPEFIKMCAQLALASQLVFQEKGRVNLSEIRNLVLDKTVVIRGEYSECNVIRFRGSLVVFETAQPVISQCRHK